MKATYKRIWKLCKSISVDYTGTPSAATTAKMLKNDIFSNLPDDLSAVDHRAIARCVENFAGQPSFGQCSFATWSSKH